jgi:FKBP-type peptidyl-prolyl cis-trans isomerase SlyD
MKVEKNKIVSVTYELRVNEDGGEKLVETADKSKPLSFPYGANLLLPAFEDALKDKVVGDTFEAKMTPENGYGFYRDNMIANVPKGTFEVEGKIDENMLQVGNVLPMMTQDGNVMNGTVKNINNENVTMDFNHPLAGKNLHFKGEILEVRDATDEELKNINQ